ncbi:XRE family transcriptional regulator [Vibrio sp. DNB22_10_4]|jgi:DNA-binding phage protein
MKDFETHGFEFFGDDEKWFRTHFILRLETLMAHQHLTKNGLAKISGLAKTSLYQKMDFDGSSYFTTIELFRIAKALDISIFQLFPVDDVDRNLAREVPLPASSLKYLDEMLSAPQDDIELMYNIYQTLKTHRMGSSIK